MQTRYSEENSVRPSVRLSVRLCQTRDPDKTEERLSRFLYHTKEYLP